MYAAAGALIMVMVAMSVAAGPLQAYASKAASDQMNRSTYLHAVMGQNGRGHGKSQDVADQAPAELYRFGHDAAAESSSDAARDDVNEPTQIRPVPGAQWIHRWRAPMLAGEAERLPQSKRDAFEYMRQLSEACSAAPAASSKLCPLPADPTVSPSPASPTPSTTSEGNGHD